MWTKFNDYPVARSTLGDILVEAGEHLNLIIFGYGDEIVLWYSLLCKFALIMHIVYVFYFINTLV